MSHEIEVYVRFCETDAMGHVNNTSFFFYIEEARTKYFESLQVDEENRDASINFIVASIKCDYISQAFAQQILKLTTEVTHIGTTSFTLSQTISDSKSGQEIATASTITVCYDYNEQKTVPIPAYLRKKLKGGNVSV